VFSSGYGLRADAVLMARLDDVRRRTRYTASGHTDRHDVYHGRGGFWNNPDRAAVTPFTKADVTEVRASFRELGLRLTWQQVDVLLSEAYGLTEYAAKEALAAMNDGADVVRDHWRAQRRRRVDRRRDAHKCTMCSSDEILPEDRTTCDPCGRKANARKARRDRAA
jgi:hypothetical protein